MFVQHTADQHLINLDLKANLLLFQISIPRKDIVGEVEMQWIILAKQDIPEFYSETLNDDYQGHASFPLGAVIAEIGVLQV